MVTDFFGLILQEIGKLMEIPDLHPDSNNSCLIKLKSGVNIQLELDETSTNFIIGCDLGEVSAGRYREMLFLEALKINGMPSARNGILAYSKKLNHLILYEMLEVNDINGEKIFNVITPFIEKAVIWKEAVSRGEIPAYVPTSRESSAGMFGVR